MREYPTTAQDAPTLVLAHGAGAGHDHPWMRRVAEGLAARGVRVVTFNFPYTEAGRKVPDRGPVLEEAYSAIWREVAASANGPAFAGGKSMGGRMASHVAARHAFTPPPAGLIFFGYPLHPPGKPEQRRDKHLAAIDVQMLFLSGTTDPFGSPDELRELMKALPLAALELFDGGDHSIVAGRRADPNGQLLERAMDTAAGWMRTHTNYA